MVRLRLRTDQSSFQLVQTLQSLLVMLQCSEEKAAAM
jgi:hypothetical protein